MLCGVSPTNRINGGVMLFYAQYKEGASPKTYSLNFFKDSDDVKIAKAIFASLAYVGSAPLDKDLIVETLKAHYLSNGQNPNPGNKFAQCRLEGDYAIIGVASGSGTGGGEVWLKKNQGVWSIAWEGQNYDPATQASKLGFPVGFGNSCSSSSPVIYTY